MGYETHKFTATGSTSTNGGERTEQGMWLWGQLVNELENVCNDPRWKDLGLMTDGY